MRKTLNRGRGPVAALAVVIAMAGCAWPVMAQEQVDKPSLADLMALTQLRQNKLWYAQKTQNWDLARYEFKQFQATIARMAKLYPTTSQQNVPGGVREDATRAMDEISAALEQKSQKRFEVGFTQLNKACNGCHQAADVGFIVVRTPTRSPYANQDFFKPKN
jgi:hypothetical protein